VTPVRVGSERPAPGTTSPATNNENSTLRERCYKNNAVGKGRAVAGVGDRGQGWLGETGPGDNVPGYKQREFDAQRAPRQKRLPNRFDQAGGFRQTAAFAVAIELHVVEPAIVTGFFEQFGVRADFFDVALIHHDDLISRQDR